MCLERQVSPGDEWKGEFLGGKRGGRWGERREGGVFREVCGGRQWGRLRGRRAGLEDDVRRERSAGLGCWILPGRDQRAAGAGGGGQGGGQGTWGQGVERNAPYL